MIPIARKILLHDTLRFLFTVSGVAFAVTLVIAQTGLFLGILGYASLTIEKANADLWVTSRNAANVDFAQPFPEGYLERVRSTPGVARADNLIVWYLRVALPTGALEGLEVYALKDFRRWNLPWDLAAGDLDDLRRGRFFALDDSAARRFGTTRVGDYREINGARFKLTARTREVQAFTTTPMAFLDYRFVQQLDPDNLDGRTTYILVKLAPGADREAVRRELQRRLPYNDVHTREAWAEISRRYWIDSTGLGLNMYLTVFLGCLVGIVIVAQTLYTSVLDHFKEFATAKAIGASNLHIYSIVAKQALIAALVGFVIGAAISYALRPAMAQLGLNLGITPIFVAKVFVGTIVLCLLASMVSFRKISKMDPAMVFRG